MQGHEGAEPAVSNERRTALREALTVYVAVSAATWLLSRLEAWPPLRGHLHLAVGTLFLVVALRAAERLPGGMPRYGMALGGLFAEELPPAGPGLLGAIRELLETLWRAVPAFLRELGVTLLVMAVVFPPFVFGFALWHGPTHPFEWLPQRDLPEYALTQVLVVGLPEEALFRGYFQGRLQDVWPGEMRALRASVSATAWISQAALFALLHFVVDLQPARLAVFFPALLFGWLRGFRGGIGAAVLLHAACNLLSDLLVRGWL